MIILAFTGEEELDTPALLVLTVVADVTLILAKARREIRIHFFMIGKNKK
jgi:hypothetical protein